MMHTVRDTHRAHATSRRSAPQLQLHARMKQTRLGRAAWGRGPLLRWHELVAPLLDEARARGLALGTGADLLAQTRFANEHHTYPMKRRRAHATKEQHR